MAMIDAARAKVLLLFMMFAACGAACGKQVSIDSPAMRRMLAKPATGEPAPPSRCDSKQECERECGAGMANACTRWADESWLEDIERATSLWLGACRQRDGEGCARLMSMVAHDPDLSLQYARRACAYRAAQACFLLGKLLVLRGHAPRAGDIPAQRFRDAATVYRRYCELDDSSYWNGCVEAAWLWDKKLHDRRQAGIAMERAVAKASPSCMQDNRRACEFVAPVIEVLHGADAARDYYRHGCRLILQDEESPERFEFQAEKARSCVRARDLGVFPPDVSPRAPRRPIERMYVDDHARVAGNAEITPSVETKRMIAQRGNPRVVTVLQVCTTKHGFLSDIKFLTPAPYIYYNRKIFETILGWRYKPLLVNGKRFPVCTSVTFVYHQLSDKESKPR